MPIFLWFNFVPRQCANDEFQYPQLKGLTQPENTSFCAATTSSNSTSYQPPTKKSKQTPKQKSNKNSFRTPKSEPQDVMENEYNEEMNIENEDYFTEKPFMKSYEPMFTLKDQIGDKLKLACNRCPTFDENGKLMVNDVF